MDSFIGHGVTENTERFPVRIPSSNVPQERLRGLRVAVAGNGVAN